MKLTNIAICLMAISFLFVQGYGQTAKIEITKFIVDGQEIECEYKLTITIDGKQFKPSFENKTFIVPEQVREGKDISVKLQCNEFSIVIAPVGKAHFYTPDNSRYEWFAGIDTAPFEEADVPEEIVDKVAKVHYIKFFPYDYVATMKQVFFPKKRKSSRVADDNNPLEYTHNLSGTLIEQLCPSSRVVKNVIDQNGDLETVQSKKSANYGFWNYAQNFTYM